MCVTKDTVILTNRGSVSIENLMNDSLNTKLLGYNVNTCEMNMSDISLVSNQYDLLYTIYFASNKSVKCGAYQKFFKVGSGIISASDLEPLDQLAGFYRNELVINIEITPNSEFLYSFNTNNFFANAVLVFESNQVA